MIQPHQGSSLRLAPHMTQVELGGGRGCADTHRQEQTLDENCFPASFRQLPSHRPLNHVPFQDADSHVLGIEIRT